MLSVTTAGDAWLTWQTTDGNGGNVVVQCNVCTADPLNEGVCGVFARGSSVTAGDSTNQYAGWIEPGSGGGTAGITLYNGESSSTLATLNFGTSPTGWITLALTCNGTSLTLTIIDMVTGLYLNSDRTWQSSPTACISVSDSAISGSGYSGVYAAAGPDEVTCYFDNFALSTAP